MVPRLVEGEGLPVDLVVGEVGLVDLGAVVEHQVEGAGEEGHLGGEEGAEDHLVSQGVGEGHRARPLVQWVGPSNSHHRLYQ